MTIFCALLALAALCGAWFLGMASIMSILRRFYPVTFRTLQREIKGLKPIKPNQGLPTEPTKPNPGPKKAKKE